MVQKVLVVTLAAKEENCKVATVDVPGAYFLTELKDEKMVVKFRRGNGGTPRKIDPKSYEKYIVIAKAKTCYTLSL